MKKYLVRSALLGFPLGIAIGFVITVMLSICANDGVYYPVKPELIRAMGNELNAVILQTVLCGLMGSGFAMASAIWSIDSWSLAKQSGIYFSIACAITLLPAYFAHWMVHSVKGFLLYVGIYGAIFVFVWLTKYLSWRRKIKKINESIE